MSLERLKKYSEKTAFFSLIAIIVMIVVIVLETVSFMWQALMPGKLNKFFNIFRIYAPFISNIDNNALTLFELAGNLFNNLFVFLILVLMRKMFLQFKENLSLEEVVNFIKKIALVLAIESIAVPVMKMICYTTFVKLPAPTGTFDICPIIVSALVYFIGVIIESKSVTK